jgi:hypothetical protein
MISWQDNIKYLTEIPDTKKNLLWALSLLAPCLFGSLLATLGRSGFGRHFLSSGGRGDGVVVVAAAAGTVSGGGGG